MKMTPYIFIAPNISQGSHGDGWQREWQGNGLPPVQEWVASLPEEVFQSDKLSLLFSDAIMHPLRVSLDEKVKASETAQFLLWKLKRFLPWPADQVEMRYLPLQEENTWLTYSLPKPWLKAVHEAFDKRKVHCGYMGGAFSTLLEHQAWLKNQVTLCFFEDFFLMAELDNYGNYLNFSIRRLPYCDTKEGRLAVDILHDQDLGGILAGLERPLRIINLSNRLDEAMDELRVLLQQDSVDFQIIPLTGTACNRLQACLSGEVTG